MPLKWAADSRSRFLTASKSLWVSLLFISLSLPLIIYLSFYFRGPLDSPASSRSFQPHSFLLGSIQLQKHPENSFMFTPPPSPQPSLLESFHCTDPPVPSLSLSPPSSPHKSLHPVPAPSQPPLKDGARKRAADASMLAVQDRKRRTAWRTGLAVVILPLLLASFTLFARYASRPHILDLLPSLSPGTRVNLATGTVRAGHSPHGLHPRQKGATTMQSGEPPSTASAGVVFPSKTPTSPPPPSLKVPTIPSSPPVLPTPFPQPFDTTLTLNFTTNSCETFFLNMTQSLPFRQCRPFSFLSQVSSAFLQVSGRSLFRCGLVISIRLFTRTSGTVERHGTQY